MPLPQMGWPDSAAEHSQWGELDWGYANIARLSLLAKRNTHKCTQKIKTHTLTKTHTRS